MNIKKRLSREDKSALLGFKKLLTPLVVMAAVVVFFLSYNTYLVDHSLEDLKFALDQTAKAENITEIDKIALLLDDVLVREVVSFKMDSLNVINLEFTKNVVAKGGIKEQLKDIEFMLSRLVRAREKKRGNTLLAFDRMNKDIQNFIRFITRQLPAGAARPEIFKPTAIIDVSLLKKGKDYEQNWQLREAISAYEEFINKNPTYPQLRLVKLHLANSYFKSLNYSEAERLYEGIIKEAPHSGEAKAAELLLSKVRDKIRKKAEKAKFDNAIIKLIKETGVEADYNELGLVDVYLDKLNQETKDLVMYVMRGVAPPPKKVPVGINLSLLEKAKDLEDKWRLKEAQKLYEDFIVAYPTYENIASVKLLLAGVYLKSMQYQKALEFYEGVVNTYPESKEADLARRLISKTKEIISIYQKRKVLVERISKIKTASQLAQNYYNLGIVNIYIFDLKSAENSFKKVIELLPGSDLAKRAEFLLAWSYKFGARYEEGIATFSKFIEKNPNEVLAVDSTYHIADTYYKWGKYEEAAKGYEDFATKFTTSPISQISLLQAGYTYLYNLHHPLRASDVFKELKRRYPETDVATYISESLVPTTERSYRDYGFILLRERKLKEAKEAFKKAIAINMNDAWAHCGLGTTYVLLILFDEGIGAAGEGVKRLKDEYTHAALAFAYDEKGEFLKAIEEYRLSIVANPNYVVSHYNLARDYLIMGWYDLAIGELKKVIKIVSDFAEAHNNLGAAYWYKGQIMDAESEFKMAISYKPKMVEAHYNLGILYYTSEKYHKAADYFNEALSLAPDLKSAKRHLEQIVRKMKKY